jgi:hypothetical protein
MSAILKKILVEALEDEYKARASYQAVIRQFGDVRPFINIVEAEGRHIDALLPLFDKYAIEVPEDDWAHRVSCPASLREACQMGVTAEIDNAEMYHRLIAAAEDYPDVQAVLRQLQRASAENHLPAFQRCLSRSNMSAASGGRRYRGGIA